MHFTSYMSSQRAVYSGPRGCRLFESMHNKHIEVRYILSIAGHSIGPETLSFCARLVLLLQLRS